METREIRPLVLVGQDGPKVKQIKVLVSQSWLTLDKWWSPRARPLGSECLYKLRLIDDR